MFELLISSPEGHSFIRRTHSESLARTWSFRFLRAGFSLSVVKIEPRLPRWAR